MSTRELVSLAAAVLVMVGPVPAGAGVKRVWAVNDTEKVTREDLASPLAELDLLSSYVMSSSNTRQSAINSFQLGSFASVFWRSASTRATGTIPALTACGR